MKKIIITGAGGFIGKHLAEYFLSKKYIVYGVDIKESLFIDLLKYENFKPIIASFDDYYKLIDKIEERNFDLFYHFAWQGVFGDSFKDYELQLKNTKFACDALNIAIKLNCKKFIFAGTINEFEVKKYLNKDSFEPRFTCIYASCKLLSEMILKTLAFNNNIEYSSGLIAMAYGEGNRSAMLPNIVIKKLLNNEKPKLIEGNNLYDMIYIDDIVRAFDAIGFKGKNMKSYYVGHRKLKIFREWLIELGSIINKNIVLEFGEYKDTLDMDYNLIDTEALYQDTGFECQADFKSSILKTASWIKENL